MRFDEDTYMYHMILHELQDILGDQGVSTSESDRVAYSVDYYWVSELWHERGSKRLDADFIVFPENSGQVSRVMTLANEYRIPVTVWGGGGGSQGGALPVCNGIVMDMKKMNKIIDLDTVSMTVEVQAGIIMQHLEWELEKNGVSTMHFPASIYCSTVGGFIAHRGTGVLSTKYGKMEDMVVSMEVVLPSGEIIRTLKVPKTASGIDLNWFFIGSEGTLGIITEVKLVVRKIPEVRKFQAFLFKNLKSGLETGRRLMHEDLIPSVIRLYDEAETKSLIKRVLGIDREGFYLVYAFEGKEKIVGLQHKYAKEIMSGLGGEDLGTEMGEEWWLNRYKFFFPPYAFSLPQAFGTCDTVATYSDIEKIYFAMKKTVEDNYPKAKFIGHFSHWFLWGCMLYARFIVENPPQDPGKALHMYNSIWDDILRAVLANDGVLNEHHGIGIKIGRLMKEQYKNSFRLIKDLKKQLDCNNVLNPGKMGLGF
ncbi:MAG: FAD-binding oxidoreductase [Actinobacteria bacterium]|nr:FAD-binding oxidoreductase [Actinomycetota bacterium]